VDHLHHKQSRHPSLRRHRISPSGIISMLLILDHILLNQIYSTPIADLPLVSLHLTSSKELCACAKCYRYTSSNSLSCLKHLFFKWLARITMDIFPFSFFDSPVSTLVRLLTDLDMPNSVERSIHNPIST
jgi:hypothetical protein